MSTKPKSFDRNLIIIGGGSAGLVSAYIAATLNAKVTLIEKHKMGGDCLNTGCVPSKALIRSAKLAHQMRSANHWGIMPPESINIDFASIMQRVHDAIGTIEPNDSIERYTQLGVEVLIDEARVIDPYTVQLSDQILTAENIIIATGASPIVPAIEGIEHVDVLTSDSLWTLDTLPKDLLVIGGGPIGCELSQAFARLGASVSIVDQGSHLMSREDTDVSDFIAKKFNDEGIKLHVNTRLKRFEQRDGVSYAILSSVDANKQENEPEYAIPFDKVLMAIGRQPNLKGFGLEEIGVDTDEAGRGIAHNAMMQTNIPSIYVCGDVAGSYQFTHTAAHQAWFASVNALFKPWKKFKVDYRVIPWATFTDPEVARVGLNEQEAKAQNLSYEIVTYSLSELDRAITDGETDGWVKIITPKGKDTILGATIVGAHAGDLISELVLAMKYKIGLNKLLGTIHIYPTWAEANKYAAGVWKKQNKPDWLLKLLKHYWRWRR